MLAMKKHRSAIGLVMCVAMGTWVSSICAGEKPNIIYINADDLGWADLSCQGSSYYETPNIDRLAQQGMRFTDAYAPAANCAPSRAACMSGMYTPRHGVYTVGGSDRGKAKDRKLIPTKNTTLLDERFMTIAEALKATGYATIHLGKWHLGEDPRTQGFDINIGGSRDGGPYRGKYLSPYNYPNCVQEEEGEQLTDRLGTEAIAFIKKHRAVPFFMHLATFAVHGPNEAKPELVQRYSKKPRTEAHNDPTFAGMIHSLDENVGRIMQVLDELGLAEKTLVLFTSDNGGVFELSKQWPLRAGKGSYYEGGIREPLIVRWPGKIKPGSECSVPVIGIDFYPTFLDAASARVPDGKVLDGVSLMPLLTGTGPIRDRALYWHFPIYLQAGNEETRDPLFRTRPGSAIRYGDWKLQEYFEDGSLELFNLKDDLGEKNNLAVRHPEKVRELHDLLKAWRREMDAPVPTELNPKYEMTPNHKFIKDSHCPGGLIVCVNTKDLAEVAQAIDRERFLLHGLFTDKADLVRTQAAISKNGLAGKVTLSLFDGKSIPFVDNAVNLLIGAGNIKIAEGEILRALTPRGAALVHGKVVTKPVPPEIDDWPHNLYDAGNTGVSEDLKAGSPRHLQWRGNPRFSRSHDGNSSFLAMVSAGGRIFYMVDEGSTAFLSLPSKWNLVARDGFNGKVLWRKPLPQTLLMQIGNIKNSFANLGHRMVAQEDLVFATLGYNEPVRAMDSRTGDDVWQNKQTANTEELILYDSTLYCAINTSDGNSVRHAYQTMEGMKRIPMAADPRKLMALDAGTGEVIWEKAFKAILPLSLTAGRDGVFIHDGTSIVAMDRKDGKEIWRSEPIGYYSSLQTYSGVNMVLKDGVLMFACGTAYPRKGPGYKSPWKNKITALDTGTGSVLWQAPHSQDGIFVTQDMLIADGLLWHGAIDNSHDTGDYVGLDFKTGKVGREFVGDRSKHMPHARCYRNRATERYIFTGRTGIDIFDVTTGKWDHNYWLRGACRYGVMPANGLLYNTPSVCTCFINSKIKGLNALADDSPTRRLPETIPQAGRLVSGRGRTGNLPVRAGQEEPGTAGKVSRPTKAPISHLASRISHPESSTTDWPTFRGAPDRHAFAATALSGSYAPDWKTRIGGKLTQPVIAEGIVCVGACDEHAVYALDERNGKVKWRFQAGGIVDSPPTIWKKSAIFGCRDGWVYCLKIADGKLVWKYRAAPLDRRIISCENVESVWPVNGSVLVLPDAETKKGRVYCIVGRSVFLDGGMRSMVLDAETGEKLAEDVLNELDPATGKHIQEGREWPPDLPAGLPDVLSYTDGTIYMGTQPFNLDGTRREIYYPQRKLYTYKGDLFSAGGKDAKPMKKRPNDKNLHLFSTIGFLDDSEMHRSVWMYGNDSLGGCWGFPIPTFVNPSGQILCLSEDRVYGYGRQFYNEGKEPFMHLFATSKNPDSIPYETYFKNSRKKDRRGGPHIARKVASVPEKVWAKSIDLYVRAMLAGKSRDPGKGDLVCAVGFPEVIDEYDAVALISMQQETFELGELYQKEKAARGELGAKFIVVSAENGKLISETQLDSPAVFDGMAAANDRIFISDMSGNIVSLKPAVE